MFRFPFDAYVNPVNTKGIMGKGLALHFKRMFNNLDQEYRDACDAGVLTTKRPFLFTSYDQQLVICLATKTDWRKPSKLSYVKSGLAALPDLINGFDEFPIDALAIPALGCGLGGLDWLDVEPLIIETAEQMPNTETFIFPPTGAASY